jgi:hypothetical protein
MPAAGNGNFDDLEGNVGKMKIENGKWKSEKRERLKDSSQLKSSLRYAYLAEKDINRLGQVFILDT